MKWISYLIFRTLSTLFSILPFRVIYIISDFLAFFFHKILRYRYNTVSENLNKIYPNLTPENKAALVKKIYKNLADISVESIKGLSMSKKSLQKRHYCLNPELLDEAYAQNSSVILVTGHYGNWEWGAFSPNFYLKHQIVGFYKPLTNELINDFVAKRRARWGTTLADINDTNEYYEKFHNKKAVFLVAGDQAPTKPQLAIWMEFLGQPTACLHGLEKYLQRYNLPVVYCYIKRVRRGFYELKLEWIKDVHDPLPEYGETTVRYMKILEKVINNKPENWLWTHRRWKHELDKETNLN